MLGKDVYVKAYLTDTLLAMKELEENLVEYEVLPEAPHYPYYHECLKKSVRNERHDYSYFLLDREREKEWSEEE